MQLSLELLGKLESPQDGNKLLYAPVDQELTYRRSRRYVFDFEGEQTNVLAFAERILFDEVSQIMHVGDSPVLSDYAFMLDYRLKPGALDHEKETIVDFHNTSKRHPFVLYDLQVIQRVYIFGEGADAAPFVRDIVNPAIHRFEVIHA